jgi:hypothetical protein
VIGVAINPSNHKGAEVEVLLAKPLLIYQHLRSSCTSKTDSPTQNGEHRKILVL